MNHMVQKTTLKQQSNEFYEKTTQNLPNQARNLLEHLIFNFDYYIIDAPGKQKDPELIYYLRNMIIKDYVFWYTT
jgi:hypothetical protein